MSLTPAQRAVLRARHKMVAAADALKTARKRGPEATAAANRDLRDAATTYVRAVLALLPSDLTDDFN